jgi:hypothetical protein
MPSGKEEKEDLKIENIFVFSTKFGTIFSAKSLRHVLTGLVYYLSNVFNN